MGSYSSSSDNTLLGPIFPRLVVFFLLLVPFALLIFAELLQLEFIQFY